MFTSNGTFIAALFNGECCKCPKKFHYSYHKCIHYCNISAKNFFQLSSQTIFEISLIHDMTNNISVSACSFQSRAEVYNENFRDADSERLKHMKDYGRSNSDTDHPWKLTEKRVEDAWFLYHLVSFFAERNELDKTNFYMYTDPAHSQRKDVDALCNMAREKIIDETNPWVYHRCKQKGVAKVIMYSF